MSPSGHQCDGNATVGSIGRRSGPVRRAAPADWPGEALITISELGEFGLIAAIAELLPGGADLIVGPGDDAALIRAPDGRVVATTDMLIEGRHFRRDWSAPADIGHKAAARNLADVAAMGARPTALLVAFAGPGDLPVSWALELVGGIVQECSAAGAVVAGGDTSSADTIMLAITALGDLAGSGPVTRSGARPGDVVAVAGNLGSAAAGLELLTAGLHQPGLEDLISAHRRPRPPYDAGPQAAQLGATSMIDISDGLLADLGHVAQASGVLIDIDSGRAAAEPLARVGALTRAAAALSDGAGAGAGGWLRWVLAGGDDHAMTATFPASVCLPEHWIPIGQVAQGRGVTVDGSAWSDASGWEHFRA
jgi:thiamine-monophosphate kinase